MQMMPKSFLSTIFISIYKNKDTSVNKADVSLFCVRQDITYGFDDTAFDKGV